MTTVAVARAGPQSEDVNTACRRVIDMAGGLDGLIQPGQTVLVKPNLVAPVAEAVTNVDVLSTVVQTATDIGANPVIGECPGFEYDSHTTFDILKVRDVARGLGVEAINFEDDGYVEVQFEHPRVKSVQVARAAVEADAIINVPKMKCHKLTDVSLAMKNCFGMLHKNSRREIHAKGLDAGIAALYRLFRPAMNILEGLVVPCTGAVYGEYANLGAVAASTDMLALDTVAAKLLGFEPADVAHIAIAGQEGTPSTELVGEQVEPLDLPGKRSERRRWIYRRVYVLMSSLDHYLSKLGASSFIPWFHSRFGVHPSIDWRKCNLCGDCLKACPVGAIDLGRRKLDYDLCSKARCMLCLDACREDAISIKQAFKC